MKFFSKIFLAVIITFSLTSCNEKVVDNNDFNKEETVNDIYNPGVYVNYSTELTSENGYKYVVVFIDDYGSVSGVHIDETYHDNVYYTNKEGEVYVLVGEVYRYVSGNFGQFEVPEIDALVGTHDLVRGVNDEEIKNLELLSINKTKYFAENSYVYENGITFKEQADKLTKQIVLDNGTKGITLQKTGYDSVTSSVDGVTMPVGEYIELIDEVLENDAAFVKGKTVISDEIEYGLYKTGTYFSSSDPYYDNNSYYEGYSIDFSLINVDKYGSISGVYLDSTVTGIVDIDTASTKKLLDSAYISDDVNYFTEISLIENSIEKNQSFSFLDVNTYSIDTNRIISNIKKSINEAIYREYKDGTYQYKKDENNFYVTIYNSEIVALSLIDTSKDSFEVDLLNKEIYYEFIKRKTSATEYRTDINKMLNYDVAKDIFEILYDSRTAEKITAEFGYNLTNLIGDGSYYTSNDEYYLMLTVTNNEIVSIIFDKLITEKKSDTFLELSNITINNQTNVINKILNNYSYFDFESVESVSTLEIYNEVEKSIMNNFDELLGHALAESANNKLVTDKDYIESYIIDILTETMFYEGLDSYNTQIPTRTFLMKDAEKNLSNRYKINYSVDSEVVSLQTSSTGFVNFRVNKDFKENFDLTLKGEVLFEDGKEVLGEFEIKIPFYTKETMSKKLFGDTFNSFDHFKILSGEKVTMPYSNNSTKPLKNILYISSDDNIFSSNGEAGIVENGKELLYVNVYIDSNLDGLGSIEELIHEFSVEVYSIEEAINELINDSDLEYMPKEIKNDLYLSNDTGIIGLEYYYTCESAINNVKVHSSIEDKQLLEIVRNGTDKELELKVAIQNDGHTLEETNYIFLVLKADVNVNENYANEIIDEFNFDSIEMVFAGFDLNFDGVLSNLKFKDFLGESGLEIQTSDKGLYIDQKTGHVIGYDNTLDETVVEIVISVSYPGKNVEDTSTVSKKYQITILSDEKIKNIINEDLSEFSNMSLSLTKNKNRETYIYLPKKGRNNTAFSYSVDNDKYFDIVDGKLLVKAGTYSEVDKQNRTILTVESSFGGQTYQKEIEINII